MKIICKKIGLEVINQHDADTLWRNLRNVRNELGSRERKLIDSVFLKDRIIGQIINFAKIISHEQLEMLEIKETQIQVLNDYDLIFYKDDIDWIEEEYKAYIYDNKSKKRIDDETEINAYIFNIINELNGFIVLPLGTTGDVWTMNKSEMEINPGDSFLIIGNLKGTRLAEKIIKRLLNDARFALY